MAESDPIQDLAALGDLRVWSVVITFFGDAVRPDDRWVPASALAALCAPLDLAPTALRTALHRLARDGWIARERRGRQAFYALTSRGQRDFGPARRRIYAAAPGLGPPWALAMAPVPAGAEPRAEQQDAMKKRGWIALGPGQWLGHATSEAPGCEMAIIQGTLASVPGWMREILGPQTLQADYVRLETALARCSTAIEADPPDPLRATVLRTLLIHVWRRLLLRHPDLPAAFFPEGWAGERCRARVLALHATLSPAAEAWIETALADAAQPK